MRRSRRTHGFVADGNAILEGFRRNQNYVLTSCVSEYESIDPGPIINVCLFSIFFQNLTLQIGKVLELEDVDNGLDDYRSTSNLTFEQYRYYLFKEVRQL